MVTEPCHRPQASALGFLLLQGQEHWGGGIYRSTEPWAQSGWIKCPGWGLGEGQGPQRELVHTLMSSSTQQPKEIDPIIIPSFHMQDPLKEVLLCVSHLSGGSTLYLGHLSQSSETSVDRPLLLLGPQAWLSGNLTVSSSFKSQELLPPLHFPCLWSLLSPCWGTFWYKCTLNLHLGQSF